MFVYVLKSEKRPWKCVSWDIFNRNKVVNYTLKIVPRDSRSWVNSAQLSWIMILIILIQFAWFSLWQELVSLPLFYQFLLFHFTNFLIVVHVQGDTRRFNTDQIWILVVICIIAAEIGIELFKCVSFFFKLAGVFVSMLQTILDADPILIIKNILGENRKNSYALSS